MKTMSMFLLLMSITTAAAASPTADECMKKIKADPTTVKAELKMVTLAPAGSQWAHEFQGWTDDALSQSNCQVLIKWYWNGGGGGDEMRMVADLRQGQKHGAAMTVIGLGDIYKDILLFQLPGLFENWPALDTVRNAERAFFEGEFQKRGFVIVGWGDVGAAKFMSVGTQVKVPADLRERASFYLTGDVISPVFYNKIGVKGRAMGIGEVGSRLGKDVQILNLPPYAAEQLQLAATVTNMTAMTTAFVIGALVIKKEKLDAMSPEHREIVLKTGRVHADSLTANIRQQDGQAFARLKATKTTYTPTPDELTEWQTLLASTRKALRGAPFTPEVFDRIVKK